VEITVTGRHVQVTDRFRRHLDEKLAKIPQLAPRVMRVDVVISHEPNPRRAQACERVEITCHVKRSVIRAEACADEEYAALDLAMTKLLERIRRAQDRRRVHRGRQRPESVGEATARLASEPVGLNGESGDTAENDQEERMHQKLGTHGNSPIEVREKVHPSVPMGIDQALNNMELVGHDFYLFEDIDTGQPCVVYRRRGWSYGVLRLDRQEASGDDEQIEGQLTATDEQERDEPRARVS
jgi:ribosomal subunit interface protein